jgi:hypothetical protein
MEELIFWAFSYYCNHTNKGFRTDFGFTVWFHNFVMLWRNMIEQSEKKSRKRIKGLSEIMWHKNYNEKYYFYYHYLFFLLIKTHYIFFIEENKKLCTSILPFVIDHFADHI